MRLKDHYKTLEILPSASQQEIKKAYRRLAFQYHPDQNPDSHFATAHFKELHEAYSILSHTEKRKKYDEERWLSGMSNRMQDQHIITPEWILNECKRLHTHMSAIDTHRMSHRSLSDYVFLILSDSHMAILQKNGDNGINSQIINEILIAIEHLHVQYLDAISQRLMELAGADNTILDFIFKTIEERKKRAKISMWMPLYIIIIAVLLAIFMYLYGGKY